MRWQKDVIMFLKAWGNAVPQPSFQSIIIQYSAPVHNSELFIKLSNMEEHFLTKTTSDVAQLKLNP